jgi:hypothetical protein
MILAANVIAISRKIQRIIQQDRNSRFGGRAEVQLDTIHRSIRQTVGVSPDDISRCSLSSLTGSAALARSSFPSSAR